MKLFTGWVTAVAVLLGLGVIWIWGRAPRAAIVHAAEGGPSATVVSLLPPPVTTTASQPVQVIGGGTVSGSGVFVLYVVPKGKRLVVEHFSSEAGMMSGTTVNRCILGIANDPRNPGKLNFDHFIPPSFSFAMRRLRWGSGGGSRQPTDPHVRGSGTGAGGRHLIQWTGWRKRICLPEHQRISGQCRLKIPGSEKIDRTFRARKYCDLINSVVPTPRYGVREVERAPDSSVPVKPRRVRARQRLDYRKSLRHFRRGGFRRFDSGKERSNGSRVQSDQQSHRRVHA